MFHNIQMLRACAAMLVFAHHAAPQYAALNGAFNPFLETARFGFAGVDIFFVVSGFVAAHTTLRKPRTLGSAVDFVHRRLARIFLGYWPFFLVSLALFTWKAPVLMPQVDLWRSFTLTSVDQSHLLMYVTWSLSYELIFYALFAMSFALRARSVVFCLHLLTLFLVVVLASKRDTALSEQAIFAGFLLEFVAGTLVYFHRGRLAAAGWIPLLFIALAGAVYAGVHHVATDGVLRFATFGAAAACLVLLAVAIESRMPWGAPQWIGGLGDASYTLYLAHVPLLVAFYFCGLRDFLASQTFFWREMGFWGFMGASLVLCRVFYVWAEAPLYRRATAWPGRLPSPQPTAPEPDGHLNALIRENP